MTFSGEIQLKNPPRARCPYLAPLGLARRLVAPRLLAYSGRRPKRQAKMGDPQSGTEPDSLSPRPPYLARITNQWLAYRLRVRQLLSESREAARPLSARRLQCCTGGFYWGKNRDETGWAWPVEAAAGAGDSVYRRLRRPRYNR